MATLMIMEQYRDEFCTRVKIIEPGWFGNPPVREARGKNRLSFQSVTGIRPTPLEICATPVHYFFSPKTLSPCANSGSENNTPITTVRSAPLLINADVCNESIYFDEQCCYKNLSFPELWAGPTYSNSPPASSLPMPTFSIRQKRTVSLELPISSAAESAKIHPIVKSAPPSPTRGHNPSTRESFHGADTATRTLRRILNLDVDSE